MGNEWLQYYKYINSSSIYFLKITRKSIEPFKIQAHAKLNDSGLR